MKKPSRSRSRSARTAPPRRRNAPSNPFPVVGIGASAGGQEALAELFGALPADTGMAFIVIRHLAAGQESHMDQFIAEVTDMPVHKIDEMNEVKPNHVYVIPPHMDIALVDGNIRLVPRSREDGAHRPVDLFFRTMAVVQGKKAVGVLLSGAGNDGTAGAKAVKAHGGLTFAQDPSTARHGGMASSAMAAGAVDFVLSVTEIAAEIIRLARHPYLAAADRRDAGGDTQDLDGLFRILRRQTGMDFSAYKRSTLRRRIARRMTLHKIDALAEYVKRLSSDPQEVQALYNEFLIKVTSFFRDPESFRLLKNVVLPRIFKNLRPGEAVRLWVPGCSTGEEVYSLAILLAEFVGALPSAPTIQIFGTDISDDAIEKARHGIYGEAIAGEVSAQRLRRFFARVEGGYQIAKPIRDMCIFAKQNMTKDPPFSRLDLISCRNVLIYLDSPLQRRVLPLFHYALKPGAFLLLGPSETVGPFTELFHLEEKRYKLFTKKTGARTHLEISHAFNGARPGPDAKPPLAAEVRPKLDALVDRLLVDKFTPAAALVNSAFQILQFRGDTKPFLRHGSGEASLNLLKMAEGNLAVDLRIALNEASRRGVSARREGIALRSSSIDLEVTPIGLDGSGEKDYFLVVFRPSAQPAKPDPAPGRGSAKDAGRLRQELAKTKRQLQAVVEEQEATYEEFQSANEEIISSNEELQSINEELETAKEELESSNEELLTVNEELQNRVLELSRAHNDLSNLLTSVNLPIVMVGADLHLRRFTPPAEKLLHLHASDLGRPLADVVHGLEIPNLETLVIEVIDAVTKKDFEVKGRDGRWYSLRIRPYKTSENKIDGAVLVFVDIHREMTARKQALLTAQEEERRRIARDMHDDLGQILISIHMGIERAMKDRGTAPLAEMLDATKKAIGRVRELSYMLHPTVLDDLGLKLAVQSFVRDFSAKSGIKVDLSFEVDNGEVPANAATHIYRIIQEGLTNMAKHAQAKRGSVHCFSFQGKTILKIKDDGKGFDPEALKGKKSLGLLGIRERVDLMDGECVVRSSPGKGTEVQVSLPQARPESPA